MPSDHDGPPSPRRQVTAFVLALLLGALGVVGVPSLFWALPKSILPGPGNGAWTTAFWIGLPLALIAWLTVIGARVMDRVLRKAPAPPFHRSGIRGWASLAVCLVGLAAGLYASGQFVVEAIVDFNLLMLGYWNLVYLSVPLVGCLVSPTIGLLAARAVCQRWLQRTDTPAGPPPGASGAATVASPAPGRNPETPLRFAGA